MYVFCLSCPSATFALQRGGFVPREWLAAKGLSAYQFRPTNQNIKSQNEQIQITS